MLQKCKYLAPSLSVQFCMHEEIKERLNSGNVCCRSYQSLLFSILLF